MTSPTADNPIARLNDHFRRTFAGGRVVVTHGVASLAEPERAAVFDAVRAFEAFDEDNDPHGEHDFGTVTMADRTFYWKIDYYDPSVERGSEDPADPTVTVRMLTIMLASEY